jgi:hypothetical protein
VAIADPRSHHSRSSCNRQLAASDLINRPADVTRSTVQMAVVVLARQPVFGPIRDKLGLITRTFFAQRDFTETSILVDFYSSLQLSMRGAISETTFHMGTSLRELIHKFRGKTLVLLKLLLLQKRLMFFGYPVEALCTFQYSLVRPLLLCVFASRRLTPPLALLSQISLIPGAQCLARP